MKPCRKKCHRSEDAAYGASRRMGKGGKFVQPYFCKQCKCWHTGTSAGLRKKRLDYLFDLIGKELRANDSPGVEGGEHD